MGFNGVVLIGRGEEVVFEEAYGFADLDLRVPMRTDYRFRIGPLTKPDIGMRLTALASVRVLGARGAAVVVTTEVDNARPELRARRRSWVRFLRRIFEVDPLRLPTIVMFEVGAEVCGEGPTARIGS